MSYQNGLGGQMFFGSPHGSAGGGYGGGYGGGGGRGRGRGGRRDDRGGYGGRGGGSGGRGNDRAIPESTNVRFRKMVIRLGDEETSSAALQALVSQQHARATRKGAHEQDFDVITDPPRLASVLKRGWREGSHGVCDGFRIGITQEPHKMAYYVVLLLHLSRRPSSPRTEEDERDTATGEKRKASDSDDVECGLEVLEDLSRGLRSWVEGREWLNMRLCLQFFSLLLPAGLVSASSLLELYKSLLSVLNELGGGGDRAERVIRAVSEGLLRSGQSLNDAYPEEVEGLIGSIEMAILGRRGGRAVNDPLSPILADGEDPEAYQDSLGHLLAALHALRANDFAPPECLPRPWEDVSLPDDLAQSDRSDLPAVSMPPETYEIDDEVGDKGEGQTGGLKFFADDVVPPPNTPLGWTLRSLVLDIVNIFEVNRKECARLLLAIRQHLLRGTFKSAQPSDDPSIPVSTISLESLIISTILGTMFALPKSPLVFIYYGSVITELCKLSPNTVAPPVGRAVRRLYGMMGTEGLDCEIARRAADWFAVHLSNFGFQWMWKEWIPDLSLPASHPKRAFMRRVVELEVRLAYHDRILETLPEPMQAPGAGVIESSPPDPIWPYEKPDHPLHAEAVALLKLYRQKASPNDIRSHLESLPSAASGTDEPISSDIRIMAFQTLLHLGARSFSHFLNATERYLDTLRFLTPDPPSRRLLLESVSSFWKLSGQMQLVTIDKYIQYGVLEGLDVVDWVFGNGEELGPGAGGDEADKWTDGHAWEVLRMCLDKHVGRVTAVKRRLRAIEREDEAAKARKAAEAIERGEGVGEDIEVEDRPEESNEARDARTSLDIHSTRLEKLLIATAKHFITSLLDSTTGSGPGLQAVLTLLDSGEEGWWSARSRFGWWKEFVRRYEVGLRELRGSVEDSLNAQEVEGRAGELVKAVWKGVMGDE